MAQLDPAPTSSTPAAPATRALVSSSEAAGRMAMAAGILSAPAAAIASAMTYVVLGVFERGGGPMMPDILVAMAAGIAVTMFTGAGIALLASKAVDDARAASALALVPWSGALGTALGVAMPIAVWVAHQL